MDKAILSRSSNLDKPNLGTKCYSWLKSLTELRQGTEVVVYNRMSSTKQAKDGKLEQITSRVVSEVEELGFKVKRSYTEICSGKVEEWDDRNELRRVLSLCRETDRPLIIPDITRLARPEAFHAKDNPYANFTKEEILFLKEELEGINIYALNNSIDLQEIASIQKRRGLGLTRKRLGRPKRVERPLERKRRLWRVVVALKGMQVPRRRIAKLVCIPEATVRKWLKTKIITNHRKPRRFAQRRLLRLERCKGYAAHAKAIELLEGMEQKQRQSPRNGN